MWSRIALGASALGAAYVVYSFFNEQKPRQQPPQLFPNLLQPPIVPVQPEVKREVKEREVKVNDPNEDEDSEKDYLCPISYEIMDDPVILKETSNTFDRKNIQRWFDQGHNTDPLFGDHILNDKTLIPNRKLKDVIDSYKKRLNNPKPSVRPEQVQSNSEINQPRQNQAMLRDEKKECLDLFERIDSATILGPLLKYATPEFFSRKHHILEAKNFIPILRSKLRELTKVHFFPEPNEEACQHKKKVLYNEIIELINRELMRCDNKKGDYYKALFSVSDSIEKNFLALCWPGIQACSRSEMPYRL